jgi:predicted nucleic acid-binding protein
VIVLDVSVLLAAHRRDHPHHVAAGSWLANRLADPREAVIVPDLVWVGFIRIAMNPRVF